MIKGVDLSTYQRNVDYKSLKESGIDFAIIRCGYGKDEGQKDDMFEIHYKGCKDAGIKVGAYLYSYCSAVENADLEAKNCLELIAGKYFELPVFYDVEEERTANLGRVCVTEICLRFCKAIEKAGYRAGVYANLNWFKNYINSEIIINEGYKIWLAQWEINYPTADFNFDIWQFTDNLEDRGIDGNYLINESVMVVDSVEKPIDNSIKELAVDVILGKFGNGEERKNKLGIKYSEVQELVNQIYNIIKGE